MPALQTWLATGVQQGNGPLPNANPKVEPVPTRQFALCHVKPFYDECCLQALRILTQIGLEQIPPDGLNPQLLLVGPNRTEQVE